MDLNRPIGPSDILNELVLGAEPLSQGCFRGLGFWACGRTSCCQLLRGSGGVKKKTDVGDDVRTMRLQPWVLPILSNKRLHPSQLDVNPQP